MASDCNSCGTSDPEYTVSGDPAAENASCSKEVVAGIPDDEGDEVSTNQGVVTEMLLLGRSGDTLVRFALTANGYIKITNGVATVETTFPATVLDFLHATITDPTTAPLDADFEMVANATGELFRIAGLNDQDSIRYWDFTTRKFKTVALSELPDCFKGCLDKSACVELVGLDATTVPNDGTVRKRVGLSGSGLVVIEDLANPNCPTKPLSKARAIDLPEDTSSQKYLACYSFTEGWVMTPLNVTDGDDGVTPNIGGNGNWFIDGADTGVPATGETGDQGFTPVVGPNGNWFINGSDTGFSSKGDKGDKGDTGDDGDDGSVVTIGGNGNWFIDGVDTGVSANIGDATLDLTTATVEVSTSYTASLSSAQELAPNPEALLNFDGAGITGDINHSNGNSLFTIGTGIKRVDINFSVYCSAVDTADNHAVLKLSKTSGSTTVQSKVGLKGAGYSASFSYTDVNPSDNAVYFMSAVAFDVAFLDGVDYDFSHFSITVTKDVTVVTNVQLT